uniref:Uncharacterized protein n=1 Tax=Glossina brevipalpis TaxID=37001 RepID=A0A1A9WCD4_9MUSC
MYSPFGSSCLTNTQSLFVSKNTAAAAAAAAAATAVETTTTKAVTDINLRKKCQLLVHEMNERMNEYGDIGGPNKLI